MGVALRFVTVVISCRSVYRITFPRGDLKVSVGDFAVAPGLALTSWVAFHRMGGESMMMGDMVMLDTEEPGVVAKLVELGLGITAIHNHMLYDEPRLFMLHFWGVGDPGKLATGLKAALYLPTQPL